MVKSKEDKSPRITVACNACRSRKQKCSGKKPVCQQCLEYNRPCNWPEQLRRGPPKGHIEALEHRLQVTENALLRLLSQVSDTQLEDAFPSDGSVNSESPTGYTPLARIGKKGIDGWAQFPLDTADNIRKWQRVYTGQDATDPPELVLQKEQSLIRSDDLSERKRKRLALGVSENRSLEEHVQSSDAPNSRPGREAWSSSPIAPYRAQEQPCHLTKDQRTPNIDEAERDVTETVNIGLFPRVQNAQPFTAQTGSTWDGAPSLEFQQRFLW